MAETFSLTHARTQFSQLLNRASRGQERFLILRRGRPMGAIVSAEDLARLESSEAAPPPRGLLAAVGAMADMDDFEEIIEDILRQRATRCDREVGLE